MSNRNRQPRKESNPNQQDERPNFTGNIPLNNPRENAVNQQESVLIRPRSGRLNYRPRILRPNNRQPVYSVLPTPQRTLRLPRPHGLATSYVSVPNIRKNEGVASAAGASFNIESGNEIHVNMIDQILRDAYERASIIINRQHNRIMNRVYNAKFKAENIVTDISKTATEAYEVINNAIRDTNTYISNLPRSTAISLQTYATNQYRAMLAELQSQIEQLSKYIHNQTIGRASRAASTLYNQTIGRAGRAISESASAVRNSALRRASAAGSALLTPLRVGAEATVAPIGRMLGSIRNGNEHLQTYEQTYVRNGNNGNNGPNGNGNNGINIPNGNNGQNVRQRRTTVPIPIVYNSQALQRRANRRVPKHTKYTKNMKKPTKGKQRHR